MKPPEDYAREYVAALADAGETGYVAPLVPIIARAQADARRAALELACKRLDDRIDELSKPTRPELLEMRSDARAEAIYCSELVRVLLDSAGRADNG